MKYHAPLHRIASIAPTTPELAGNRVETRPRSLCFRVALLLAGALLACPATRADYTVKPNTSDNRGTWDGWGTSLAWWGKVVGNTGYQSRFAQLIFSYDFVDYLGTGTTQPGLGFNILRYNVGGGGQPGDYSGKTENVSSTLPWHKDIDGYWINATTWNWNRDPEQRAMMTAARDMRSSKGLSALAVEFFSNAPMWWMTTNNSSDGGGLLTAQETNFAHYVAQVAAHAKASWGVTPVSVEAFNEPAAGWWTYPAGQEGCVIDATQQCRVVAALDSELSSAGISGTTLAASDESYQTQATATYNTMKSTTINGVVTANRVDRVNTHSYSSTSSSNRTGLRSAVGSKSVWVSEYGNSEASGRILADQIVGDLYYLKPHAWVYWQAAEATGSGWGLVTMNIPSTATGADRGKPAAVNQKYYVLAQFARFLRNGYTVYGTPDQYTVCGYEPSSKTLTFTTVNHGTPQKITYDLSPFSSVTATSAAIRYTATTSGGAAYVLTSASVANKSLSIQAATYTVYSIQIIGVSL